MVSIDTIKFTRGGIRTHEAEARDLKPRPFDRSGTRVFLADRNRTSDQWKSVKSSTVHRSTN